MIYKSLLGLSDHSPKSGYFGPLFEAITGQGLRGSFIALLGRVGGGIYTRAADVGADLAGKADKYPYLMIWFPVEFGKCDHVNRVRGPFEVGTNQEEFYRKVPSVQMNRLSEKLSE